MMTGNTLEDLVRRHVKNIDPNLSLFETMLRLARDVAESAHVESQRRFQAFLANESVNQLAPLGSMDSRSLMPGKPKTAWTATCPFPGCTGTPIRPQRNFCSDHAKSLDDKEKLRLRTQQKAAIKEAARAAR